MNYAKDYSKSDLPRTITRATFRRIHQIDRKNIKRATWWKSRDAKEWLGETFICWHCAREISNRQYWGPNMKGANHFKGTCNPETFFPVKIPKQSWKAKFTTPMPAEPNYRTDYGFRVPRVTGRDIEIRSMADFCKFWGVPMIGETETENARDAA